MEKIREKIERKGSDKGKGNKSGIKNFTLKSENKSKLKSPSEMK